LLAQDFKGAIFSLSTSLVQQFKAKKQTGNDKSLLTVRPAKAS